MMRGIQKAVYSPEQSKQLALSVAEFYRTLVEAGMPPHQAQALTNTHMANLQHTISRSAYVRIPDAPPPPPTPDDEKREHRRADQVGEAA